MVAITVDDCYTPEVVQAYVDLFTREGVNATFFPVGKVLSPSAALWRRVAAAGFPVANHTWSHTDLTKMTQSAVETEIRTAASVIRSVTGRQPAPFFRPMGGSWNDAVLRAAGRTGQAYVVLWDVSSADTGRGTAEQVAANASTGTNGSILLFHANQARSVEAMAMVIDHYRAAGFEFVTLGQLFGIAGPVPFPKSPGAPPTPRPTTAPTPTPSPTPTPTPAPTPTPTPSPTPTPTPTPSPPATPGATGPADPPSDTAQPAGLGPVGPAAPTAWIAGASPAGPLPAIDRSAAPPPVDSWTAADDLLRGLELSPVSRSRRSGARG